MRLTASSAGLFAVRVADARGRLLARGVHAAFAPATTAPRIALTRAGRRVLRRARDVRVRVSWDFRDLLTGRSSGLPSRAVLR